MKCLMLIVTLISFTVLCQTGPGGVGNSTNNGLWLKADDLDLTNGTPVDTLFDRSGNNNHGFNTLVNEQPEFQASSPINGRPSLKFDGVIDQMVILDADILDNSSGITYYTVVRPNKIDGQARAILGKRISFGNGTNYAYTFFFYTGDHLWLDVQNLDDRISCSPTTFSNNTNYMLGFDFDGSRPEAIRSRFLSAGTIIKEVKETSTFILNSNQNLVLGGLNFNYNSGGPKRYGGDFAEILHYNRALNTAERKIVENYLGAKYGIAIANDLYTHQGGYAGEVAGIGRDDAANFHDDAQGSAMVRINTPSSLEDGDFMIWGHNESSLDSNDETDVDGTVIESRMSRVWAVTKTNDVGTVTVSFDHSQFSPINPSDLRLLIDSDGDGFNDNDVTPIVGSVSGSSIIFTGVNFSNNDRFTLGSINSDQTPLPVELTLFDAILTEKKVEVLWSTASELNADYYLLSKSSDGKSFNNFLRVKANGNTTNVSNYKEYDDKPYPGISYYQLTQVDFNGEKTQYGPISVNNAQEPSYILVPNPTNGAFQLKSNFSKNEVTTLFIYNFAGKLIDQFTLLPEELNTKIIERKLAPGLYLLGISSQNEPLTTLKFLVE